MITISSHNIEVYSRCPRRSYYGWNGSVQESLSFHARVIRDIIQAVYLYSAKNEKRPTWKKTISWMDKYIKRELTESTRQEIYKDSKKILMPLHKWYFQIFLPGSSDMGLINVPLIVELDKDFIYKDEVPLILFGDTMKIGDFKEVEAKQSVSKLSICNDIEVLTRIWATVQIFNRRPSHFVRTLIGPNSVKVLEVVISDEMLAKTNNMIKYILTGVRNNVWYPSFSEQCQNCPFNNRCNF